MPIKVQARSWTYDDRVEVVKLLRYLASEIDAIRREIFLNDGVFSEVERRLHKLDRWAAALEEAM